MTRKKILGFILLIVIAAAAGRLAAL